MCYKTKLLHYFYHDLTVMTEPLTVSNSIPLQQNTMSKSQAYKIQEDDVMPSKPSSGTVIEQVL